MGNFIPRQLFMEPFESIKIITIICVGQTGAMTRAGLIVESAMGESGSPEAPQPCWMVKAKESPTHPCETDARISSLLSSEHVN
jgi:hypothetical protein